MTTNHSSTIGASRLIRAMIRYIILYSFKGSVMSCYVHAHVILISQFPISVNVLNNLRCKFWHFKFCTYFHHLGGGGHDVAIFCQIW